MGTAVNLTAAQPFNAGPDVVGYLATAALDLFVAQPFNAGPDLAGYLLFSGVLATPAIAIEEPPAPPAQNNSTGVLPRRGASLRRRSH